MNKKKTVNYHVLSMFRSGGVTKYYRKDPNDIKALLLMHQDMYPKASFLLSEESVQIEIDEKGNIVSSHFMEI